MNLWTLLVPLGALFVLVGLTSAAVVSIPLRSWLGSGRLRRQSSAIQAAIISAPTTMACLVCVAVLSEAAFGGCHCYDHDLHHPHFCFSHPGFAAPLFNAGVWIVGLWAAFALPRLVHIARAVLRSQRWVGRVRRTAPQWVDGIAIHVVDCSSRTAFTIGAIAPLIVFDSKLWDALSPVQRRAVVHHEAAHAKRYDGFTLLALRLFRALFPVASAHRLTGNWCDAVELRCDRHAARMVGDEAAVADALVAVERARNENEEFHPGALMTAMAVTSGASIERRVVALLDGPCERVSRTSLVNDMLTIALVATAVALAITVSPGDAVHHGVETVVGQLSHFL